MITKMILSLEPMQSGRRANCLIFSTLTTSPNSSTTPSKTDTWSPTSDKCQFQLTSRSTLRIGDHLVVLQMLMVACGNSKLDPCCKSQVLFQRWSLIKKVIVGIYAIWLSRNSWCVMKEAQSKSTRLIFTIKDSGTIHVLTSLRVFSTTVDQIFSSQCLKCTKLDLWVEPWSHRDTPDFNNFQMHMVHSKTERFFTIDLLFKNKKTKFI